MEIKFTEEDKMRANRLRDSNAPFFISSHSEKCSLELKINDLYKCSVFIQDLFYNLRNYTKEECGFEVSDVSLLGVHSDFQNLREDVNKLLDKYNL